MRANKFKYVAASFELDRFDVLIHSVACQTVFYHFSEIELFQPNPSATDRYQTSHRAGKEAEEMR